MANAHSSPSTASERYERLSGLAREYDQYDGLGLAELIAKKQITPMELLNVVRGRVEVVNPKLNPLCHIFFEKAEAQIHENLGTGPFRGVPFVLKDLGIYMKGAITSAGGRVWKEAWPTSTARW